MVTFFNTPTFLFLTIFVSLGLKTILLSTLIPKAFRLPSTRKICCFLILVLLSTMIGEISWCFKLTRLLLFPFIPYSVVVFLVRIAWGFLIIKYQALGLFLNGLVKRKFFIDYTQKILLTISSVGIGYYLYLALFDTQLIDEQTRHIAVSANPSLTEYWEISIMQYTVLYLLPVLIIYSLFICMREIKFQELPKILHLQLTIIIKYLIIPYTIMELLIGLNSEFSSLRAYTNAIVGISALLITYIIYYCIRRIIGLRFLNFTDHVETPYSFNFVNDFKIILEQLSFATTEPELITVTHTLFHDAFHINPAQVSISFYPNYNKTSGTKQECIEEFISGDEAIIAYLVTNKILIYDELAFSNFYQEDAKRSALIRFLDTINADIFLPILDKNSLIAAIAVTRNARPGALFSKVERDQMIVFASYLSNIINLLQHRNLESLLLQENELRQELYKKNQEIDQYKESIRSFLKNNKQKEIGILFYKNRRFVYANQSAKEMIKINIHTTNGHPLTRALKQLIKEVEDTKKTCRIATVNDEGNRLIIAGIPNEEQNNIIITINYPDIADVLIDQRTFLKDPTKWDYLLYLETTRPGQLINQLIPGSGKTLLNFKISLLQTALSKKATLLELPSDDLMPTVELLHHISMRENLHTITLKNLTNPTELLTKLCGINAIFGIVHPKPLLEKLNNNGTLFIQNIEYLDLESQAYLAEFIQYGCYRPYKSDHKISSNVRIICSTHQDLEHHLKAGTFLPALYNELAKTHIRMPSIYTLSTTELTELAQGFTAQALKTHELKDFMELSGKEKEKLLENRPLSLQELKTKVQQLLIQKSKKNNIEQEIQFDPAYALSDPELIQARRLGKHALRDSRTMVMLWNKFKNQNKIATFLGVNRSSVNRRCKEYNIELL